MSYWATNRPATPKVHDAKPQKAERSKEAGKDIWDYGFHAERFRTTQKCDFKGHSISANNAPRLQPKEMYWFAGFDYQIQESSALESKVENNYVTTNRLDFCKPGFEIMIDLNKPAGRPTNNTDDDHLGNNVKTTESCRHKKGIFLPSSEQSKRIGIQKWSDFPEAHLEDVNDYASKDSKLIQSKLRAVLTVPTV